MRIHLPNHYQGQERTIKRFALFPIRAGHEIRWLEKVYIKQYWLSGWGWKNSKFSD